MVDTIKFSEMISGGDINNDDKVPGLLGGANVLFNNPWTFLPPGTTAQRPTPSPAINYRLRFNTDLQEYEFYDAVLGDWTQLQDSAFTQGPFVIYTDDPSLADAQNLGALANGILKQTIALGVATLDIAVQGTDYYGPGDTPTFAGMILTGDLDMGGFTAFNAADPVNPQDYATKNYVDNELGDYLPLSGGTMAGDISLDNAHRVTDALNPVDPQDYATKFYVDQTALNGTSVYAASAGSLGTVTQSGAGVGATLTNAGVQAVFELDGVNPPAGVNVLIKNTATGMTDANEGIYTVTDPGSISTDWVLTRATTYDTPTEINNTGLILIQNGSTLAGTAWYNADTIVTVDTTPFDFVQFGNVIFPISLAQGGTSASLTPSEGGIFYSTAAAGAILSGTATARKMLQSGAMSAPTWSTAAYPDLAGTAGNALLSDGTNFVSTPIPFPAVENNSLVQGRLTLTSGVPVTTADVTAATTVYFTPYTGNQISLFDGSATWTTLNFTELSIAVPATTDTVYDVFCYNNSGTPTLELTAWTNDTTRATALAVQDGVYVRSGATTRRYIGSFRTTGVSGQTEDSFSKRYLYNYYNRELRPMSKVDTTGSWTYSTQAWRQARADATNQLDFVIGVSEDAISVTVLSAGISSAAGARSFAVGVGIDSTTVNSAQIRSQGFVNNAAYSQVTANYSGFVAAGRHTLVWLEFGGASDTQTFLGTSGSSSGQSGINAIVRG